MSLPPYHVEFERNGREKTLVLAWLKEMAVAPALFPEQVHEGHAVFAELSQPSFDPSQWSTRTADAVAFVFVQPAQVTAARQPSAEFAEAVRKHVIALPEPSAMHAPSLGSLLEVLRNYKLDVPNLGEDIWDWPDRALFDRGDFVGLSRALQLRRDRSPTRRGKRMVDYATDRGRRSDLMKLKSGLKDLLRPPAWVNLVASLSSLPEAAAEFDALVAQSDAESLLGSAFDLGVRRRDYRAAQRVFDELLKFDDVALNRLNNALYIIDRDNTGEPPDEERARRYLKRVLPEGPNNPSIFFGAACILMQLGELEDAIDNVELAVKHGFESLHSLRRDRTLKALIGTPRFDAIFEGREPLDAPRLVEFAADVGDSALSSELDFALRCPPTTPQDTGFYGSQNNPPLENCFRFLVSELQSRGLLMASEDKYSLETLERFGEHIELPGLARELFPFYFDDAYDPSEDRAPDGAGLKERLPELFQAIEQAFVYRGLKLLSIELAGGDHVHFIALEPTVAERWRNVSLAQTRNHHHLGLRDPDWYRYSLHLEYAIGVADLAQPESKVEWS
ncbi:MAG: hypothetical protein AAF654_09915 [Myxococcota bacterium]